MKKFIHYTVVNSIVYTDTSREKFSLSFFIDEIKIRRNLIKYTKGSVFNSIYGRFFRIFKSLFLQKVIS